jgi:glycerol-3-phosphate acyltransferase PlsY
LTLLEFFVIFFNQFQLLFVSGYPIDLLSLALSGALGYLLGSVPAAYLLVRWKARIDIRTAGSGNVGTLNSLQVTGSRLVGAIVLVVDVVKGALSVVTATAIFGSDFAYFSTAGILSVLGHNYPVWLGFKGGRGLATAAGVMIPLSAVVIVAWGLLWVPAFLALRNVNVGNAIATSVLILLAWILPEATLAEVLPENLAVGAFRIFATLILIVILAKHVEPVTDFLTNRRQKRDTLREQ